MDLPLQIEQRPVIKYLLVETYKPCEIYWRICDMDGEAGFIQINISKSAKHGFITTSLSLKDNP